MLSEITAGLIGATGGLGGVMIVMRFLNAKIDKKQDKALCVAIAKTFEKGIEKSADNHEKVMEILGAIQVSNGRVEQQLKYLNGKND